MSKSTSYDWQREVLLHRRGYQFRMRRLLLVNSWKGHQSFGFESLMCFSSLVTGCTDRMDRLTTVLLESLDGSSKRNGVDSHQQSWYLWLILREVGKASLFLEKKLSCRLYSMVVDVQLLIYFNSTLIKLIYIWLDDVKLLTSFCNEL